VAAITVGQLKTLSPRCDELRLVVYVKELNKWYDVRAAYTDHKVLQLHLDEENPR
jgi:hypothetical protein